jgi:hypothetical protein
MSFSFELIAFWAEELYEAAGTFQGRFGVAPNLMSAGIQVYRAIDDLVAYDRGNVVDHQGRHPGAGERIELAGFSSARGEILFTINEITPAPGFLLIFDEDPTFDGEEEPVGSGHVRALRYRAA